MRIGLDDREYQDFDNLTNEFDSIKETLLDKITDNAEYGNYVQFTLCTRYHDLYSKCNNFYNSLNNADDASSINLFAGYLIPEENRAYIPMNHAELENVPQECPESVKMLYMQKLSSYNILRDAINMGEELVHHTELMLESLDDSSKNRELYEDDYILDMIPSLKISLEGILKFTKQKLQIMQRLEDSWFSPDFDNEID